MGLKRILTIVVLLSLPVIVVLSYGKISVELSDLFGNILKKHFNSYPFQFGLIALAAISSALLAWWAQIKKRIIAFVVLIFLASAFLRTQYQFYEFHSDSDYGDMKNIPECMKEKNFSTFWEYLNEGCHLTLSEFMLSLSYKSITWIGFFFLTDFVLRSTRGLKNIQRNSKVIDGNIKKNDS